MSDRFEIALQKTELASRKVGSAAIRVSNRISRYQNGWPLWDALDLTASPPSCDDFTPVGIATALRRMPFVRDVVVDSVVAYPEYVYRIMVRLNTWIPRRFHGWCEDQIHDALRPRMGNHNRYDLEFV